MNRISVSMAVALLATSSLAFADGYARSNYRGYSTGVPATKYASTEKSLSVLGDPAGKTESPVQHPAQVPQTDGYPFADRCGHDANPCCDHAWDGYRRSCGIFGLHNNLFGGCGGCDPCAGGAGHFGKLLHRGNACDPCGGCAGGCFGNSFAGSANSCGALGGCGPLSHLHCKLHQLGANCRGHFAAGCHQLFHSPGMYSSYESSCGCAGGNMGGNMMEGNMKKQGEQIPPAPPVDPTPAVEEPPSLPAPEKSAFRPSYPQTYGRLPGNW